MKICETGYGLKIFKTVQDYTKAILKLWYSNVWDYAGTMVWYYRLHWVAIILGNGDNGLEK